MKTNEFIINVRAEHINSWLMLGVQGMQNEISKKHNIQKPTFISINSLERMDISGNGEYITTLYSLKFEFKN